MWKRPGSGGGRKEREENLRQVVVRCLFRVHSGHSLRTYSVYSSLVDSNYLSRIYSDSSFRVAVYSFRVHFFLDVFGLFGLCGYSVLGYSVPVQGLGLWGEGLGFGVEGCMGLKLRVWGLRVQRLQSRVKGWRLYWLGLSVQGVSKDLCKVARPTHGPSNLNQMPFPEDFGKGVKS